MSKFLLHRIRRMNVNPAAENITPGLEAAAHLHWITCHEHDPERFICLRPQLPELRKHLADYLELTARETAAHLELMATTKESVGEVTGTRDFERTSFQPVPGRVEMIHTQFGFNWVLVYWDAPRMGGKPWGYRVYRTDKRSATVLVATVTEPEALLPDQPERVKLCYHVTTFNAAGESPASPYFGLMLNDPEEDEPEPAPRKVETWQPIVPVIPEHEMPIRQELNAAMITFVQKVIATRLGNDEEDSVMRQVATEEYRQAVLEAARQNIELSLAWHALAVWTEEGKERIGYFARAIECCHAEAKAKKPETPQEKWAFVHTQADSLFEIGRVHFYEDAPAAAQEFLTKALLLAKEADALREKAGMTDDLLEGRIGELLVQLPDENKP
jgi:hypothetical protein